MIQILNFLFTVKYISSGFLKGFNRLNLYVCHNFLVKILTYMVLKILCIASDKKLILPNYDANYNVNADFITK